MRDCVALATIYTAAVLVHQCLSFGLFRVLASLVLLGTSGTTIASIMARMIPEGLIINRRSVVGNAHTFVGWDWEDEISETVSVFYPTLHEAYVSPRTCLKGLYRRTSSSLNMAMERNKMLHVAYGVGDMDACMDFYVKVLGMQTLPTRDVPKEKYSNVFAGYGTEKEGAHFSMELTKNDDINQYKMGDGFKGIGITVPDVQEVLDKAHKIGATILSEPLEVKYGAHLVPDEETGTYHVAKEMKLADPSGVIFLLNEGKRKDPINRVILAVSDLEESIIFYKEALRMKLIRKWSNVNSSLKEASLHAWLGYEENAEDGFMLELVYLYDTDKIDTGDLYGHIAISTPDVYEASVEIQSRGYEVNGDPAPVPGLGTKITTIRDPDNYKVVLVDEADFNKELRSGRFIQPPENDLTYVE